MKSQDIVFLIIFLMLLWKRDPRWFAASGLVLLFLSIPLFALWVFFTAERFVSYASLFLLLSVMLHMWGTLRMKDA